MFISPGKAGNTPGSFHVVKYTKKMKPIHLFPGIYCIHGAGTVAILRETMVLQAGHE